MLLINYAYIHIIIIIIIIIIYTYMNPIHTGAL
jgi:hypothetical protein